MSGASTDNGQAYLAINPSLEDYIALARADNAEMKKRVEDTLNKIRQGRENAKNK
jgi:hypothetical protein